MDLVRWNKLYQANKELDYIFHDKYGNNLDIYQKNCIEIMVELGEFVNETKVFKYWSLSKGNKDKILEEYADVITMCLYFYRELDLDIDDKYLHIKNNNIIEVINYLYQKMSLLMVKKNKRIVKDIFYNLLYLGELLKIDEKDIFKAIEMKHKIIRERMDNGY